MQIHNPCPQININYRPDNTRITTMTQQILFLIVVLIGAYYARKYGNKAKRDIEKHKQNNEQDSIKNKPD